MDARAHLHQGLAKVQPQPLLFEDLYELGGERFGRLLGDHLNGGVHRVAGAQRARHQIDGVGKCGVEGLETAVAFHPQQNVGNQGSGDGRGGGKQKHARKKGCEQTAAQCGARAGHNNAAQLMLLSAWSSSTLSFFPIG